MKCLSKSIMKRASIMSIATKNGEGQSVSCNTRSKAALLFRTSKNCPQICKRSVSTCKSLYNAQHGDSTFCSSLGTVRHDVENRQFILDLGKKKTAHIDYKPIVGLENTVELYHSEVPKELRGKGIGRVLAEGGFECASQTNMKLKVTCTYLQAYLKKFANKKHRKLVIE